jgi:hypothetical protein
MTTCCFGFDLFADGQVTPHRLRAAGDAIEEGPV